MTDTELLDLLETAVLEGVIIWDGKGDFPGGRRSGLSLLGGRRSLRDSISQCVGQVVVKKENQRAIVQPLERG